MIRLCIFTCVVLTLFSTALYAFNDKITHPDLTQAAVDPVNSSIDQYLITFMGYSSGKKKEVEGKDRYGKTQKYKIERWLQDGSTDEDALNACRASNHFHNPVFQTQDPLSPDWSHSQMSDSALIDSVCGSSNRYSTVTWATGFTSPGGFYIKDRIGKYLNAFYFPVDARQDMGWDGAREYFYDALTSNNLAIREEKLVKTFRAIGQVMHLLQDMAVPAHVRNDMSSHLINKPWWSFSKWGSNPFEKYVSANNAKMKTIMSTASDQNRPVFSEPFRHTDFWDKDIYSGENPAATNSHGVGLAEYANANFVSDFTIFAPESDTKHYFKYPNKDTSVNKVHYTIPDPRNPKQTVKRTYYQKTGDGDSGYRLAGVGYLNRWSLSLAPLKRISPMDDNVHEDYAKKILPRTVGYSAALLDHFFRGKLKITASPGDISFRSVEVTAQNDTPGETMGVGEVRLVIRYKQLSEWPLGGNKYLLNYPADEESYAYVVSVPQTVDLTTPKNLVFDFSTETLPSNFSDVSMQLIFKGKLGYEEGAVAASPLAQIDGIYSDFRVALPNSGVYAKTSNDSLSATFNELKVMALTDIPGGLSGGTFSLSLQYRETGGDPFQSAPVDTEPADAVGFLIKVAEKNGVNRLQQGIPTELTFDLSQSPLSVRTTDLYMNVLYTDSSTGKTTAVSYHDISEPTPVDLYNNADNICINNQWYTAGSAEAITLSDPGGNGIPDLFDPYAHNLANIFTKDSSTTNPTPASATNFTFSTPAVLYGGNVRRLGYILTNYSFKYSLLEDWLNVSGDDPWIITETADGYTGTGVKNQTDADGSYTYPGMFTIRGSKMWWGAGVVYDNDVYPSGTDADTACGWANLP